MPVMDDVNDRPLHELIGTPDSPGPFRFPRFQHSSTCRENRDLLLDPFRTDEEDRPETLRDLPCLCDRGNWELVPRGGGE
jgi:hypothetical protein